MIKFSNLPCEIEGQKKELKHWLLKVVESEGFILGDVLYFFLNDEQLLKVNMQFLNHDTYTDIITFDYDDGNIVNGEIYISEDRIRDNSKQMDVLLQDEMLRVIVHGVLHLCGYKDKTDLDAAVMRQKEDDYISFYKNLNNYKSN